MITGTYQKISNSDSVTLEFSRLVVNESTPLNGLIYFCRSILILDEVYQGNENWNPFRVWDIEIVLQCFDIFDQIVKR